MLPFAALAVHHWHWLPVAAAGDYAQYLSHALALVEGRPYRDIGYIYHRSTWQIGPASYPPGWPLTLAPLVAIDGVHSPLIRILVLGMMAAFAYLAFRRLSRSHEPWQAALGASFAAMAIEADLGTIAPLSDPGFCALVWAVVLAVDTTGAWSGQRVLGVTLLGFATIAYRQAGVAMIPAMTAFALLQRRVLGWRPLAPAVAWSVAALVVVASDLPRLLAAGAGSSLVRALMGRSPILLNVRQALLSAELYPFGKGVFSDIYHIVATIFLVIGAVRFVRREYGSFLFLLCCFYATMLMAVPVGDARYQWPFFPLFGTFVVSGATVGAQWLAVQARLSERAGRVGAAVCVSAVLLSATVMAMQHPAPRAFAGDPAAEELFAWLRATNAQAPMRLAIDNPRVLSLETHIPAMGIPRLDSPEQLAAMDEERITHFIAEDTEEATGYPQRLANTLPEKYPDRFVCMRKVGRYGVYRLLPPGGPAEPRPVGTAACQP